MKRAVGCALALVLGIAGIVMAQEKKCGYLGVSTAPVDEALARHLDIGAGIGVQVTYVDREGPSHGIVRPHDVIHAIDGQIIVNHEQLATLIRKVHHAGDEVEAELVRRGKKLKVKVTLGEAPQRPQPRAPTWGVPRGGQPPRQFQPYDWRQWLPRNFHQRRHSAPRDTWEELQERLSDLMDRKQDVNEQFEEVQKRMEEIMKQFHERQSRFAPGLDDQDVQVHTHTDFSASVSTSDGDLGMTFKTDKDGKHLRAERGGDVIYDGPVNTDEERSALPEDIRAKLEEMEGNINIKVGPTGGSDEKTGAPDKKVFQIKPDRKKIEIQVEGRDSI